MRASDIHPTASLDPAAELGTGVKIGPFAVIEAGAVLGDACQVEAHAVIHGAARLGAGCHVFPHAVVGGLPQDLQFDPETVSFVQVGDETVLREGVTVHRSTQPDGVTRIGRQCFLMAQSHVAHDCVVGDHVILANQVMLAGHLTVGDRTFVGGGAAFHQFVRVGEGAMVSGLARMTKDVPPFTMTAERDELIGLNLIGLKRAGASREEIAELKRLFREVCEGNPRANAEAAEAATPRGQRFLRFFAEGKRGFLSTSSAR